MNRNAIIGFTLIVSGGMLACVCASSAGGLAEGLLGKAIWYLPYVAFVGGVGSLTRARG